jgi:threonyl-tRNA synthetase
VVVIPVRPELNEYAMQVKKEINDCFLKRNTHLYVDVDCSDRQLGKKVFEALHYNYVLVVGDAEQEAHKVSLRSRDDQQQQQQMMDISQVVQLFESKMDMTV